MSVKLNKNYLKWSIIAIILLAAAGFTALKSTSKQTDSTEVGQIAVESKDKQSENGNVSKIPDAGVLDKKDGEDSAASINISSLDFISSKVGYICLEKSVQSNVSSSYEYKLLKTADGGQKWAAVQNKNMIESTKFIDENTGFALQRINDKLDNNVGSYLVKTTDGE